ncbi:hypothetical protein EJ06DRAFT_532991 [Trichodelitschia bisporula]|uniref:Pyridoxamine 5'-phosphate oxidase N-terminal domain-containing protein n=1 Tax=Trichodelitschia bisporula TaxID=703511 RepID=A0A6G1HN01_9PEZI|nr:hypothetical protein EJ06DRAFT_532991 [Trichodelitschia bisporula]
MPGSNATQAVAPTLPSEVVTCLENGRFLHLATSHNDTPHVTLMKYTYLPSSPFFNSPTIIMTTSTSSRKAFNLFSNPRVALLVHDWISHRPPTLSTSPPGSNAAEPQGVRSSMAALLMGMNSASLSRISVSMNGTAKILEPGSEEEAWCKEQHRENNKFGDSTSFDPFGGVVGECGDESYIEGEEVQVVTVEIMDGRISDVRGGVKDWVVGPAVNGAHA